MLQHVMLKLIPEPFVYPSCGDIAVASGPIIPLMDMSFGKLPLLCIIPCAIIGGMPIIGPAMAIGGGIIGPGMPGIIGMGAINGAKPLSGGKPIIIACV